MKSSRMVADAASVAAAIALLAVFADRPIALLFGATLHGTAFEQALFTGFKLLDSSLPWTAGVVVLLILAQRVRPDHPSLRHAASAGVALWVAVILTEAIKVTIGRSQVWPQFLQLGIYELRPFQLDRGYMSFPSATMAGTTAIVTGLGLRPRLERALAAAVIVFFTALLLIISGHWASDILGGTILGLVIGRVIARRFRLDVSRS